ncbi:MAG: outer membrane beta-barrel protein [Myxococcota bacterium]
MRATPTHLFLAAALALSPSTALAQEEGGEQSVVDLSGFVDTSVFVPMSGFADDGDEVLLGLDQAEIDAEITPTSGMLVRVDLNWFPSDTGSAGELGYDDFVEQAFAEYVFGGGDTGVFFKAGKSNAPIGVEAVDPHEMYQYSHSLLFDFATPTNLTGFFGGYRGESLGAQVWVANDWDMPATERDASVGGRVDWSDDWGGVGLSSTYGPVVADDPRLMLDLDSSVYFGDFTGFVELNLQNTDDDTVFGASVKGNYAFGDFGSVTGRYSWLDDDMEITGAYLFDFNEYFIGALEVRADIPDEGDTTTFAALELIGILP